MTIKEMADKYCEGSSFEDAVMENPAFMSGANAVLKEIEKCLNEKYAITSFYMVKDKINELKGE